jgi:epoxyqueuosine reductase
VRNALIALGNSRDAAHAPLVERLLDDASPLVRAMAVWALSRLVDNSAFAKLRERRLKAESDPEIRREWAIPNVG